MIVFVIGAAYLLITFAQVVWASGRESHRPAQAIIVLGAAQYDGRPSPVLRGRLAHAVELYQQGVARTIVVTGGKKPGDRFTEAAAGYEYLRAHDVPESAILREENGDNTWEQLAAATRFLRNRHIDDVVLVSDDYHAYRLDRIAHELGLRAQVSPVDPGLSFAARGQGVRPRDSRRGPRPDHRLPPPGEPRRIPVGCAFARSRRIASSVPTARAWCNWQHSWFWSSHWGFESSRPNFGALTTVGRIARPCPVRLAA